MLALLRVKGFLAFIGVAFINAFVDLGHKIIVQNTLFKSYEGPEQIILTAIVNSLILLPFILLLSPAGFISDRFSKPIVMRWSARLAVIFTLIITLSYYQGWFELAFTMTLFLALQSALYSPAKYGFIRELVGTDNLSKGNAWIQSATMVAILSGIVVFSLLFEILLTDLYVTGEDPAVILQHIAPLGWALVLATVMEAGLAQRLPVTSYAKSSLAFDWSAYRRAALLKSNMNAIIERKLIFKCVLGLSIFWTISQVMLAVFPSFAEETLAEQNTFVIQGTMALAGVGIMFGSFLVGRWSKQSINQGLIPLGAIGVMLGVFSLPLVSSLQWASVAFLLIGISGALMTIPLNALIQFHAPVDNMGKVLAGSNFIQNISMLCGLVLTVMFSLLKLDETWLLYAIGVLAMIGAFHTISMKRNAA
ncbi:MFS transporter [Neptunomonas japonica]|uniref:MFS transporter n=1 Tax=Neptunomonas japonica TaxID=417574 RepID=UPI0004026B37|nr:MFS transporter [Neptunomonas japonica]